VADVVQAGGVALECSVQDPEEGVGVGRFAEEGEARRGTFQGTAFLKALDDEKNHRGPGPTPTG
jgi:hypothetical protein